MREYLKESWLDPRIEIRTSSIHEKGMFAVETIKKGEVVVIWGGRFVNKDEAEKEAAIGKITMQLDEDLFSVEFEYEDPSDCMNHSCDPNVWMKDEVTLIARRDIQPDEELTLDYALIEAWEDFIPLWECACGSQLCRKKFTGKDWRIPELQARYSNHFIPILNKRIAKIREQQSIIAFITGVSGVGKSAIVPRLKEIMPSFAVHDFDEVGVPQDVDVAWRLRTTDHWLRVAKENLAKGKSTIICGVSRPEEVMDSSETTDSLNLQFGFIKISDALI
ncbi:MAG: SET domain-containing protein, partial [Asgard group archaeon]|nr:SET domain-containing protein [Asgard group archaeon]